MDWFLFGAPLVLFVIGFLYETWLSFRRLNLKSPGRQGYVQATWEITHTLLVFAIVMLVMLHTKSVDLLGKRLFVPAFLAIAALVVRSICYVYIFYIKQTKKIQAVDWLFAFSHLVAAGFLVLTAIAAAQFLVLDKPVVNSQFYPYFIPGLILVLAVNVVPIVSLYKTKD